MADPQVYPRPQNTLRLTIGAVDRTGILMYRTLEIQRVVGSHANTARFSVIQPKAYWQTSTLTGIKPTIGQDVLIELKVGGGAFTRIFAGTVSRVAEPRVGLRRVRWDVQCVDYTQLARRKLAKIQYTGQTIDFMVRDLVLHYAPLVSLGGAFVEVDSTVMGSMQFNYRYVSEALDDLAAINQWQWFIDEFKQLHYFSPINHPSALTITDTSRNYAELQIEPQLDQVRNRIWVQGGQSASDYTTETFDTDGVTRAWKLSNTDVLELFMTIDGSPQIVGIQGTDNEALFLYMVDRNLGVVSSTVNAGTLGTGAGIPGVYNAPRIVFTYRFKYPIGVLVEDKASQLLVAQLANSYTAAVLNTGPVAYWRLGESSGTTMADSSGAGLNGTYHNGPTLGLQGVIQGSLDTAVRFDGVSQYATVFDTASLRLGSTVDPFQAGASLPWTIQFWVRHPSPESGWVPWQNFVLNKGDKFGVAVGTFRANTVALVSLDYTTVLGTIILDPVEHNNTIIDLVDTDWHLITYVYSGSFQCECTNAQQYTLYGFRDGVMMFKHPDFLLFGAGVGSTLFLATQNAGTGWSQVDLDEVALCNGTAMVDEQIAGIYESAQEDGVREVRITKGDLAHVAEARAAGELELAQWSMPITQIDFTSFVAGWHEGELLTVNVTEVNTGRTYSGSVVIQSVSISAVGKVELQYTVQCMSARFKLIDFWRQLVRQGNMVPGVDGSVLDLIGGIDDSTGTILIDLGIVATNLGTIFYAGADWGASPSTPVARCEYAIAHPTYYSDVLV